jgi:hypothetical protein
MVPATVGNANAAPIPAAVMKPPARTTVRSPNLSTRRSPINRPMNMNPTRAT